ncbi:MAG TPA: hypothetical protein VH684_24215 [Xanthobacteraceae bacterium]
MSSNCKRISTRHWKQLPGAPALSSTLIALVLTASATVSAAADDASPAKAAPAGASNAGASNEALLKKLDAMEQRIKVLEGQLKQREAKGNQKPEATQAQQATDAAAESEAAPPARKARGKSSTARALPTSTAPSPTPMAPPDNGILGVTDSPAAGLSVGAYGEVYFGAMQNPAANGQWQNGSDAARRLVLLPTYAITPNIIFNAEIEFEHAGTGFDNDDKLHGTAEIEQLWIDFKIIDQFNWRAPGVDLVPIGYINQHHEPTQFYSVLRPQLYNALIPSTWKVPGTSVYGIITEGLKYQVMVSASQEDFGDSFDLRTDANTVPPGPYFPGIDGLNGLVFSNPPLGDFRQLSNTMAVSGKLDFAPPFWPGFAGSVSGYYSPDTTPRNAHGDLCTPLCNPLGSSSLAIFDAEFRYRIPDTGLELRAEYVNEIFGNPANLRANNDTDPTDNVGKRMYGWYAEAAYHIPLGTFLNSEWEAVPFYRYTYQNLQTAGFVGTDLNLPTGAGQTWFQDIGIAIFPSPEIVLKATYEKVTNRDPAGAQSNSVLGGVGFFF